MPQTVAPPKSPKTISDLFSGTYTVTVVLTPSYTNGQAHWDTRSCKPLEASSLGLLVTNADASIEFFPWDTVSSIKWTP